MTMRDLSTFSPMMLNNKSYFSHIKNRFQKNRSLQAAQKKAYHIYIRQSGFNIFSFLPVKRKKSTKRKHLTNKKIPISAGLRGETEDFHPLYITYQILKTSVKMLKTLLLTVVNF
jgi:hypothetical protein